jgi:hypothetical protein
MEFLGFTAGRKESVPAPWMTVPCKRVHDKIQHINYGFSKIVFAFGWWDGLLEDELVQRNLLAGPDRSSTLQIAPEIRNSRGYAVSPMAEMLIITPPFHKLLNSEDGQNQRQKLQESAPGHKQ